MALTLVTAPAADPISLADVRAHLRIDSVLEDPTLLGYVTAARLHLEGRDGWLNRCLITQTWDWTLDSFPWGGEALKVPMPPLQSVQSINYLDAAGVSQLWDPTKYIVDSKSEPGWVAPAYGEVWPTTLSAFNAVVIRFTAGYGNGPVSVPQPIRLALLGLVGDFNEHRDTDGSVPAWIQALLAPYRVWSL